MADANDDGSPPTIPNRRYCTASIHISDLPTSTSRRTSMARPPGHADRPGRARICRRWCAARWCRSDAEASVTACEGCQLRRRVTSGHWCLVTVRVGLAHRPGGGGPARTPHRRLTGSQRRLRRVRPASARLSSTSDEPDESTNPALPNPGNIEVPTRSGAVQSVASVRRRVEASQFLCGAAGAGCPPRWAAGWGRRR